MELDAAAVFLDLSWQDTASTEETYAADEYVKLTLDEGRCNPPRTDT
jgi:hypothetical protein